MIEERLTLEEPGIPGPLEPEEFRANLEAFRDFGSRTLVTETLGVPVFVNEFWTSAQRKGHSLHEVSYRACFKPQLPAFFMDRLASPDDRIHDPFMGRGTTILEAALSGRPASGSDINPLSPMLVSPRLRPPGLEEVKERLEGIDLDCRVDDSTEGLEAFFHPETLKQILALRQWFLGRQESGELDRVDEFVRMVAINRLTGHSPGFFSVYTLPPNQATSIKRQREINRKRGQTPPPRSIRELIIRKAKSLLRSLTVEEGIRLEGLPDAILLSRNSWETAEIAPGQVGMVVTSPPFLDIVDYRADNWMRCWFAGIDPEGVEISEFRKLEDWTEMVHRTLVEQSRLLRSGGHVCFEVGEVRNGTVQLEEAVLEAARETGLEPVCVLINSQDFTKTSHLWGVRNKKVGTNTNRVVVLRRA